MKTTVQCRIKKAVFCLLSLASVFSIQSCSATETLQSKLSVYLVNERELEVWSWEPSSKAKGSIIFSHGFGSSPDQYDPFVIPWVNAGYAVYAALHVDSRSHPDTSKYKGMQTWDMRLEDASFLANKYGSNGYIAAGHSYGALLSLVKGGVLAKTSELKDLKSKDERVKLVLAFSPPGAMPDFVDKTGFTSLSVPALIQTGTEDKPFDGPWESHLDAYYGAEASGNLYALVFEGVDHYFGGAICRSDVPGPLQNKQLSQAVDLSLQMISAYFDDNKQAKESLATQLTDSGKVRLMQR